MPRQFRPARVVTSKFHKQAILITSKSYEQALAAASIERGTRHHRISWTCHDRRQGRRGGCGNGHGYSCANPWLQRTLVILQCCLHGTPIMITRLPTLMGYM